MRSFLLSSLGIAAGIFVACGGDDATTTPSSTDGGSVNADGAPVAMDGTSPANEAGTETGAVNAMELDPSFGAGGKMTITLGTGGNPTPLGIVLQSTGGIVVAAAPFDATGMATTTLFRVTSAGALDTTFQGGASGTSVDVIYGELVSGPGSDQPFLFGSPKGQAGSPAIVRFLASGAPDPAFGTGGHVEKGSGGGIPLVLANGKVVNGLSGGANVTRFDTKGDLNPTWGASSGPLTGIASITPISHYEFRALGPLGDGRLLVGGGVGDAEKTCAVIRLDATGALDKPFGEAKLPSPCSLVRGIFPNSDGSFIVQYVEPGLTLVLSRLTAAGASDAAYTGPTTMADPIAALLRRADDHLIALARGTELKKLAVWDIAPNGSVARSRTVAEAWSQNTFTALQPDGKLIVFGLLGGTLVVARYLP